MSAPERTVPVAPIALREGDRGPEETHGPLTRTDFVRYAGASGDFHPIHHDEAFAVAAGAPSVFAMGLLHGGMLGAYLVRWVGPAHVRTLSLRFLARVWPGDELVLSGRVDEVLTEAGDAHAVVSLEATSSRGETVVRARATVTVARA
jgi:acyl dehydratase